MHFSNNLMNIRFYNRVQHKELTSLSVKHLQLANSTVVRRENQNHSSALTAKPVIASVPVNEKAIE